MAIVAVNSTVLYTALFVEKDGGCVLAEKLCNKKEVSGLLVYKLHLNQNMAQQSVMADFTTLKTTVTTIICSLF